MWQNILVQRSSLTLISLIKILNKQGRRRYDNCSTPAYHSETTRHHNTFQIHLSKDQTLNHNLLHQQIWRRRRNRLRWTYRNEGRWTTTCDLVTHTSTNRRWWEKSMTSRILKRTKDEEHKWISMTNSINSPRDEEHKWILMTNSIDSTKRRITEDELGWLLLYQ